MSRLQLPTTSIPWRIRSDIQWSPIHGVRRSWWIATDLLRSKHFRCGDEEKHILGWLNGRESIESILAKFTRSFPNQQLSINDLHQIISSAAQNGLLVQTTRSDQATDSERTKNSTRLTFTTQKQSSGVLKLLSLVESWPWNWIQSRISLGNPDRIAKYLGRCSGWLFSSFAVRFWLCFMALSLFLVASKFGAEQSQWRWPTMQEWINQGGTYAVILFITRLIHEMGHAAVAARQGAVCREGGVILMFGLICPFIDVTDSWRLRRRLARIAVAMAGVYTECILAAIAGVVWFVTKDGVVNTIAWQIVMTCSLMTLLVNANPLMRYDGYFVLCDLVESANLREESNKASGRLLRSLADFGKGPLQAFTLREISLVFFGILQQLYRATVVSAIAFSVCALLNQWHLKWAGLGFALLVFNSYIIIPVLRIMIHTYQKDHLESGTKRGSLFNRRVRLAVVPILTTVCVMLFLFVPLPYRVACSGVVESKDRTVVYTKASGSLSNDGVDNFDREILLENWVLQDQLHLAEQKQVEIEARLNVSRRLAFNEPAWRMQLASLTTLQEIASKKVTAARSRIFDLSINCSPSDSGLGNKEQWVPLELPPPNSLASGSLVNESVPMLGKSNYAGYTVNDRTNSNRWLQEGTPIAYLVRNEKVQVWSLLDESKITFVKEGMKANVTLQQRPFEIFEANVSRVSELSTLAMLGTDSIQGTLLLQQKRAADELKDSGTPKGSSHSASYYVVLDIEGLSIQELVHGGMADVVIQVAPVSIANHLSRMLN